MYRLLTEEGILHRDPNLHNFLRVNGRTVAIDFEFSKRLPNDVTNEQEFETLKDKIEERQRQARGAGWSIQARTFS